MITKVLVEHGEDHLDFPVTGLSLRGSLRAYDTRAFCRQPEGDPLSSVLGLLVGVAPQVALDPVQRQLLAALVVSAQEVDGDGIRGAATSTVTVTLPAAGGIAIGAGAVEFQIVRLGAGGASVELTLAGTSLSLDTAGGLLRSASAVTAGEGIRRRTRLTPTGVPVTLTPEAGGTAVLRLTAPAGGVARLRLGGSGDGALSLTCSPPDLLLPGDVGLRLPSGLAFQSTGATSVRVEGASLVLPPSLALLGGVEVPFAVGFGADGGVDADTDVDAAPLHGRLSWHDPGARHLADLVPTGGEVALDVPVAGQQASTPTGAVRLEGPPHVTVRARLSRNPADVTRALTASVGVDSPKEGGLLRVTASPDDDAARVAVTAFAVASAVLANAEAGGDQGIPAGARLAALLGAAGAIGTKLTRSGELVLHGVGVEAGSDRSVVTVDVSAALAAVDLSLPPVKIGMRHDRPMRVRWRGVRLGVEPTAPSPDDRYAIGFAGARLDVEDPGGWTIESPGNLLDVVGSRSGHGSTWVEVDLRFALDLGPVKVSGATLRATFDEGEPSLALRGLDAEVKVARMLEGGGKASVSAEGFELAARASVVPLGLGVLAILRSAAEHDGPVEYRRTELVFGVDLPGPIPLGPTGLGLFGALGSVGVNARLPSLDGPDGIERLIGWRPWEALEPQRGGLTLGAGLVIGTAPDLAFTLSALAYLGIAVPDVAVRAGLDATILQERQQVADLGEQGASGGPEFRIIGALAAEGGALTLGMRATYIIPQLLEVVVPIAARYPHGRADWHLRLGTDGHPTRPPGPVSARVLPDLLDVGGWAFIMVEGDGLTDLAGTGRDLAGFALAAGLGCRVVLGVKPFAWAEISAHFVAAIASDPFVVIVTGGVSGGLHLGPFSLGISAGADLQIGPGEARYLKLRVCGEIDLWLTSISGCVEIETGAALEQLPDPPAEAWPFPRVTMADGHGQTLLRPEERTAIAAAATRAEAPEVWPDAIPLLDFPVAPVVSPAAGLRAPSPPHTGTTGSDQLAYTWTLDDLRLDEVSPGGAETPVPLGDLATWQDSPDLPGVAVGTALPRQLALLTAHTALWTRTASDGGRSRPPDRDPVKTAAGRCELRFQEIAWGWVLGADAERSSPPGYDWRLPPESLGLGALPRVVLNAAPPVGVLVETSWSGGGPGWPAARVPGLPGAIDPGGPLRYADPLDGFPYRRRFHGALRLAYVRVSHAIAREWGHYTPDRLGRYVASATFTFDEPLAWATLSLLVPREAADSISCVGWYSPDDGQHTTPAEWVVRREPGGDGIVRIVIGDQTDSPVPLVSATLQYPVWAPVDVLGVHSLAKRATTTATDARRAAKEQAAATAAAHAGEPGVGNRLVLKQDTSYRVRVTLSGTKAAPGRSIAPTAVAFPGQAAGPQTREYWFRTAPPAEEVAIGVEAPGLTARMWRRDRFAVAYLERYLLGYTPEDRAAWRFTKDPVEAHFSADHLVALAAAYDRDVKLSTRRTDTPPGSPDPGNLFDPHRVWLVLPSIFEADRRFHQEALDPASCPLPKAGATLRADAGLALRATYDLAAAFPQKTGGPRPGDMLPGVVFTTSRWTDPVDALRDLGLFAPPSAPGTASGDLPVELGGELAPGTLVGDGAFADGLRRLGLEALPPPSGPRSSLLWARSGDGWGLAGVLLEADEPLHRVDAEGIAPSQRLDRMLLFGASAGSTALRTHRRDRSGSRLLWLAPTPVEGATTLLVDGSQQELHGGPVLPLSGALLVPARPAFLEVQT